MESWLFNLVKDQGPGIIALVVIGYYALKANKQAIENLKLEIGPEIKEAVKSIGALRIDLAEAKVEIKHLNKTSDKTDKNTQDIDLLFSRVRDLEKNV